MLHLLKLCIRFWLCILKRNVNFHICTRDYSKRTCFTFLLLSGTSVSEVAVDIDFEEGKLNIFPPEQSFFGQDWEIKLSTLLKAFISSSLGSNLFLGLEYFSLRTVMFSSLISSVLSSSGTFFPICLLNSVFCLVTLSRGVSSSHNSPNSSFVSLVSVLLKVVLSKRLLWSHNTITIQNNAYQITSNIVGATTGALISCCCLIVISRSKMSKIWHSISIYELN